MTNFSQDVEEYLEDFGTPTEIRSFSALEIEKFPDYFGKDLKDFVSHFGRAIFEGGRLQTCHPDDLKGVLAIIFGSDKTFSHKNCCALCVQCHARDTLLASRLWIYRDRYFIRHSYL